ncbi:hypothetical protein MYAM1_000940 [Malassezia yamatoensis]|uniref:alanine--glyoxylate transaminase n=1 Tax=Malassezia yamatoensis TaxID=253288 RepID=A0AAJ6CGG0_9BASI|nr:hypothetical protein MYAM1_000940 [Malassezia yamatoensis]
MTFEQAPHKLLMIPGPIEVADDVLYENAHPAVAHVAPEFCQVYSEVLKNLRKVVYASDKVQPLAIAGSGTMGWDMTAVNALQPGEEVLVLETGYFSDGYADAMRAYGVKPTVLEAPAGQRPSLDQVKDALKQKKYRAVTITHVDTSTGVLTDVKAVAAAVREVSPETFIFVDSVCAVASEDLRFDDWGIDLVLTGSQKGLGCPPGLSIMLIGPRVIKAFEERKTPPATYYLNWKHWFPVMKAYEAASPAYFGTPPTNLIYALHRSLKTIVEGPVSLEERIKLTKQASDKVKNTLTEMGLQQLVDPELQKGNGAANGMTAVRYPNGLKAPDVLPKMAQRGIVLGAGIHKDCKDQYFRIGHMGVSVVDKSRDDVDKVLSNLKEVLSEATQK